MALVLLLYSKVFLTSLEPENHDQKNQMSLLQNDNLDLSEKCDKIPKIAEKRLHIEDMWHDRTWSRLHSNIERYKIKGQDVRERDFVKKCHILLCTKTA